MPYIPNLKSENFNHKLGLRLPGNCREPLFHPSPDFARSETDDHGVRRFDTFEASAVRRFPDADGCRLSVDLQHRATSHRIADETDDANDGKWRRRGRGL